jgi:pimeloyl-ACP methyl ester carboxylesterase
MNKIKYKEDVRQVDFNHIYVTVNDKPVHVAEAGSKGNPAIFFIHGWPTSWIEFKGVMEILSDQYHVIAVDIPGIGNSMIPLESYSKSNIAEYMMAVINKMDLTDITLVGCDVGGQVVYAFLKKYPGVLTHAVIMNVAIPGVEPWDYLKSNPYVWHFRFHMIPNLPEKLVSGNELSYFSYFYNILVGKEQKMSEDYQKSFAEAYSRPEALKVGFDFYRNFELDERENIQSRGINVPTPVLYLRGEDEHIDIAKYIKGFEDNNITNITPQIIENCGHFSAAEQPQKVAFAIREFIS